MSGAGTSGGPLGPAGDRPTHLRAWHRLGVRLAGLFALVTLIAVGAVGALTYERGRGELEDTVGTQLMNIARVGILLIDPTLHAEARRTGPDSAAYRRIQRALASVRTETRLPTPIRTMTDFDPGGRRARLVVVTDGPGRPGDEVALAPEVVQPLGWIFETVTLRRLGPGDCFGEIALVRNAPRSATARTRTRVNVPVMDQDAFQTLFAHLPPVRSFFEHLIETRTR
jgi:CRP-like cAMP-binding protein